MHFLSADGGKSLRAKHTDALEGLPRNERVLAKADQRCCYYQITCGDTNSMATVCTKAKKQIYIPENFPISSQGLIFTTHPHFNFKSKSMKKY